jgi:hypothetical protein
MGRWLQDNVTLLLEFLDHDYSLADACFDNPSVSQFHRNLSLDIHPQISDSSSYIVHFVFLY